MAGLSKPSRWRFLVKNSLTEMSRCREAIDSAVARRWGVAASAPGSGAIAGGASFFGFGMTSERSGERARYPVR